MAKRKGPNISAAVREAWSTLGLDAQNAAVIEWCTKNKGITPQAQVVSNMKSKLKAGGGTTPLFEAAKAGAKTHAATLANGESLQSIPVADFLKVKALVKDLGAPKVKALVALLAD